MSATAAYGFAKGDPKLLLTTWDADGKHTNTDLL